jgi:hypothetical protein
MSKQAGWQMVAIKESSLRILKDVRSHKKSKRHLQALARRIPAEATITA